MSNQKKQDENRENVNSLAGGEIVAPGAIAQKNKVEELTNVKDVVAVYLDGLNNQAYE